MRMPKKAYKTKNEGTGLVLSRNQPTELWTMFPFRLEKTIQLKHFKGVLEKAVIGLLGHTVSCV